MSDFRWSTSLVFLGVFLCILEKHRELKYFKNIVSVPFIRLNKIKKYKWNIYFFRFPLFRRYAFDLKENILRNDLKEKVKVVRVKV